MSGRRTPIDSAELLRLVREGYTNARLAEHFGCTVRTIDRRRREDRQLSLAIIAARAEVAAANAPQHGTARRYAIGCRCRPCTDANTLRCREDNLARRARRGLPPPDRRFGRRPRVVERVRLSDIDEPGHATLIGQAIARGETTSAIMRRLSCDYADVQEVRDEMTEAQAS